MAPKVKKIKPTLVAYHPHQHDHNKPIIITNSVPSSGNNSCSKDQKETGIKNVVADSDDSEEKTGLDISLDRVNIGSKKKLLVIPLRGIFVHRAHRWYPATIPRNCRPDFRYGHFLVYVRPYCVEFLKFCFQRFNVGLWSSAKELVS
ncbi:putative FCP1 domain, HAD superfamily protein [Helianthus annuus]|nr:putative FCP1 domain, HAD superfamily protein [Helianthus annuus]